MHKTRYNSEAQAYQQIRRDWKKLRDREQHKLSRYQWEVDHRDKHPQIKRVVMEIMNIEDSKVSDFHMPVDSVERCQLKANMSALKISEYQRLLNKYKVNKDES